MPEKGNALSRNPNICASCSSMADGIEDSLVHEGASLTGNQELRTESAGVAEPCQCGEKANEPPWGDLTW
ncbi:MAG: hypothetical protein NT154_19030 [Verrucomicrobia bacterium]|nr:hypothetical protein [Verrucomicrobiota bacterium]